jgi:hypothetical protein
MYDPQLESRTFCSADVDRILQYINERQPPACPICRQPLTSGPARDATVEFFWLMHCAPCKRGLTINDLRPSAAG